MFFVSTKIFFKFLSSKNKILFLIAFYKTGQIFTNISYCTQFYKFVIFTSSRIFARL